LLRFNEDFAFVEFVKGDKEPSPVSALKRMMELGVRQRRLRQAPTMPNMDPTFHLAMAMRVRESNL
jgi:hypothetical protein